MIGAAIMATFGLFWILEIVAHFTHYRYGPTLSARIWQLEKRRRWARIVVGLLVMLLFTHLEFHLP